VTRPALRLLFVDGRYRPPQAAAAPGVRAVPLVEARSFQGAALLDGAGDLTRTPFPRLNMALFEEGAALLVDPGARPPLVHILCVLSGESDPVAVHPRILVSVGAGAQVTLVEEYAGPGGSVYLQNAVTEAHIGENGSLHHVKLTRESDEAFHVGTLAARLERAARLGSHSVSLGGRLARHDIDVVLAGEGAEVDLLGLYAVTGRQHVDHYTSVDHASPHTVSREHYKGVLDGRSSGVFHGRIRVRPGAQKIESAQTNHNLLLSPEALVNTNPELMIEADDVQARHGATIGQVDPDQLFYLRSRGLGVEVARRLLIQGFAGEMADRLPVPSVAEAVRAYVERRF
jgi:Fe-S cluster assembly protein SufD